MPEGYGRDLFVGSLDAALDKYLPGHTVPRDDEQDDGAHGMPYRAGNGPTEFSTDTRLALSPEICWDANGWYRALHVDWRASRKGLRLAFLALGPLPTAWQMHCLKKLLDPVVRRIYNRLPLGDLYLDDIYIQEALHREAARRTTEARKRGEDVVIKDMLDRMGLRFEEGEAPGDDPANSSPETVDEPRDEDDDGSTAEPARVHVPWIWGYYLWKIGKIDVTVITRMALWQEYLVRAFAERGEKTKLAVGLHGAEPYPWLISTVGYRTVVFLRDDERPTIEAAYAVVEQYRKDRTPAGKRKAIA